jgi:hypothetical protein
MTTFAGPQIASALLKVIYRLDYLPERIRTKDELIACLARVNVPHAPWVDELWEEYCCNDSVLAVNPAGGVLRFIRTITLRIFRERVDAEGMLIEVLWETIEYPDGRIEARKYGNTVSEKMLWTETHPMRAVRRCLQQELGIRITHRLRPLLRHPHLQLLVNIFGLVRDPMTNLMGEPFEKKNDPKRPGVTTYNFIFHWAWKMAQEFWKETFREPHRDKVMVFDWKFSHRLTEEQAAE